MESHNVFCYAAIRKAMSLCGMCPTSPSKKWRKFKIAPLFEVNKSLIFRQLDRKLIVSFMRFQLWIQPFVRVWAMRGIWWILRRSAFWINWMYRMSRRLSSRRVFICHNKVDWLLAVKMVRLSLCQQHKPSCCNYCMLNAWIRVVNVKVIQFSLEEVSEIVITEF